MEEPGGLPSVESHRVGHDWRDLAAAAAAAAVPSYQLYFNLNICKGPFPNKVTLTGTENLGPQHILGRHSPTDNSA